MKNKYNIVDAAEDAARCGYSVGVFASKLFYQVSGIKDLRSCMDSYIASRFEQRLEYFTYEHDKLSPEQKETFYTNLKENKQHINYLYEFIEKARTTTYDIHAKILAKLSANLIQNGELSYEESSFFDNLLLLNETDIKEFYRMISQGAQTEMFQYTVEIQDPFIDHIIINKFIHAGLLFSLSEAKGQLQEMSEDGLTFQTIELTLGSDSIFRILKEVLVNE